MCGVMSKREMVNVFLLGSSLLELWCSRLIIIFFNVYVLGHAVS